MFMHESLSPCACKQEVQLNGRSAKRVGLDQVQFTPQGMRMIGEGVLAVANEYGIPPQLVKERMKGNLFLVPPSQSLYFLFQIPELEADMHLEIPTRYWRFVEAERLLSEIARCA
jgi:hypothetical protein